MQVSPPKAGRWVAALLVHATLACLAMAAPPNAAPSLSDLPLRFETRIPALLEGQLADVERASAALPDMDRKKAYLITLPLENYLEDVVLSANRPAVLHPRAIAWVIGREAARGAPVKEIARLLVSYYQKDLFKTFDPGHLDHVPAETDQGGKP